MSAQAPEVNACAFIEGVREKLMDYKRSVMKDDPRTRISEGFSYVVPMSSVEAAAVLLHLNILSRAGLLTNKTWTAIVELLSLRELVDPAKL